MKSGFLVDATLLINGVSMISKDAILYAGVSRPSNNSTAVSQMADDQTEGMDRRVLWASLYGSNPAKIGGGKEKLTLRYVFDHTARSLVSAATRFLHGRKVVPNAILRPEAIMDDVAKNVLTSRGLTGPIGFVAEQPDSAFK